jgi:hypothetical protein
MFRRVFWLLLFAVGSAVAQDLPRGPLPQSGASDFFSGEVSRIRGASVEVVLVGAPVRDTLAPGPHRVVELSRMEERAALALAKRAELA